MNSYGGYTLNASIIEPQAANGKVVPANFAITPEVAQTLTPVDNFNPGINATFYATLFFGILTGHDRAFYTLGRLDDTFNIMPAREYAGLEIGAKDSVLLGHILNLNRVSLIGLKQIELLHCAKITISGYLLYLEVIIFYAIKNCGAPTTLSLTGL